jgi:hypothetical protein
MDASKIVEFIKEKAVASAIALVVFLFLLYFSVPKIYNMFAGSKPPVAFKQSDKEYKLNTGVKSWNPVKYNIDAYQSSLNGVPDDIKRKQAAQKKAEEKRLSNIKGAYSAMQNKLAEKPKKDAQKFAPLNIYNGSSVGKKELKNFLPYGTPIPCELISTIQTSGAGRSPVIGIVTENVYNNSDIAIPAGTYVQGHTSGMPLRDHIMTDEGWVLVWKTTDSNNGKELKISAVALENGSHWNGKNWDLLDMSMGIPGYTVDNRNKDDLKNIAVQVVSGVGNGLAGAAALATGQIPGASGTSSMIGTATQSIGTSVAQGASNTAQVFAKESLMNLMQSDYYTTAPGGTQFYLYPEQTVDISKAKKGLMNN